MLELGEPRDQLLRYVNLRTQILKRDIPWESYFSAKLISPTDFQLLRRYDHKSKEMQAGLLEEVNGLVISPGSPSSTHVEGSDAY